MPTAQPLISIRVGKCSRDGTTIIPSPELGRLYIYFDPEEDLHHFCWKSQSSPDLEDFLIIPGDCQLIRHDAVSTGRVFMLKFSSSSQRQFYWLQEKSEGPNEEPGFWSQRDIDWIEGINKILQGEDAVDEEMGDPPVQSDEIEHEGEQPRRGGEDGGRAPPPQLDIASLLSQIQVPGNTQDGQVSQQAPTISLHDLLSAANTIPLVENMSEKTIDILISNLPPAIVPKNPALSEKKQVITRVLRSPQFTQGAVSLTVALREGALRGVTESLKVPILFGEEGSGVDQVEIFLKGVRKEANEDED